MKIAKWMLPITLLALSSLMSAQTVNHTVVAKVPFEFMVGSQVMPAGDWVVQASDEGNLAIRNFDARKAILSASTRADENRDSRTVLVFERYGSQYFLSEIRIEGSEQSYKLPATKAEKELRAANVPASPVTLLAALK